MKLYGTAIMILCCAIGLMIWVQPGTDEIPARAYCLMFNYRLIGALAVSDSIIWISYMAIPIILYRYHSRFDIPVWVTGFFIMFIFACGIGHLCDVVTYRYPVYTIKTGISFLTAAVSIGTVAGLILNRDWLNRPTRQQLDAAIESLTQANADMELWKTSYQSLSPEIDRLSDSLRDVMNQLGIQERGGR